MKRIHPPLIFISIITILTILTSCNWGNGTNGNLPAGSTGPVTLGIGAASYQTTSTITVTLSNHSTQTIYFPDHLTNCTVVLLQRQVNGNWEAVNKCALAILTRWHSLAPGQSLTVNLAPSPSRPWTAGIYRATLSYRTSSRSGPQTTIYSPGFQVA